MGEAVGEEGPPIPLGKWVAGHLHPPNQEDKASRRGPVQGFPLSAGEGSRVLDLPTQANQGFPLRWSGKGRESGQGIPLSQTHWQLTGSSWSEEGEAAGGMQRSGEGRTVGGSVAKEGRARRGCTSQQEKGEKEEAAGHGSGPAMT